MSVSSFFRRLRARVRYRRVDRSLAGKRVAGRALCRAQPAT
jgi:hypothetical protein